MEQGITKMDKKVNQNSTKVSQNSTGNFGDYSMVSPGRGEGKVYWETFFSFKGGILGFF